MCKAVLNFVKLDYFIFLWYNVDTLMLQQRGRQDQMMHQQAATTRINDQAKVKKFKYFFEMSHNSPM